MAEGGAERFRGLPGVFTASWEATRDGGAL